MPCVCVVGLSFRTKYIGRYVIPNEWELNKCNTRQSDSKTFAIAFDLVANYQAQTMKKKTN